MINFSKVDTLQNLVDAINALPASTSSAEADDVAIAKQAALTKLKRLTTNGASVNMRVNSINSWSQTEIQVAGRTVETPKPTAPASTATATPA